MLYEGVLFLCQPIQDVSWGKHWGPTRALECGEIISTSGTYPADF